MSLNFLDFEQPIAELEAKIDSLTAVSRQDEKLDINIDEEVHRLREKSVELTRKIFADLGAWQIAQLARHPQRPYTLDYVRLAFDEFDELAGDRAYADDKAIVGGIARLDGRPVMIIGHQKGRETKEKIRRNFGMPAPEGYRKALRLMQMAERFKMPIITFIAHANRQRAARTTFTDNGTNSRYAKARHFTQVACNGFRLTALFCAHARISPRGVDKGDDWRGR